MGGSDAAARARPLARRGSWNGPFILRVGGDSADQSFWERAATDTRSAAAQWARAAQAGLPRHSIIAFEVGNEPDIYSRGDWRTVIAGCRFDGRPLAGPSLPPVRTARDYVRDFRGYAAMRDEVART